MLIVEMENMAVSECTVWGNHAPIRRFEFLRFVEGGSTYLQSNLFVSSQYWMNKYRLTFSSCFPSIFYTSLMSTGLCCGFFR